MKKSINPAAVWLEVAPDNALKAIEALRKPDASLKAVANTIRQSLADLIEAQKRKMDHYGVALMMIREGCEDPSGFAGKVLSDAASVARKMDDRQ